MSNVVAFINPFQTHRAQVPAMDVLVADGCADTRERVRTVLTKAGHRVTVMETGEDALDHLGGGTIQVVLSAARLPDMDVRTLSKTLRLMQAGVAARTLVVATAHDVEMPSPAELSAAGIAEVLAKPIQQPALLDLMARLSTMVDERSRATVEAAAPTVVKATSFDSTVLDELSGLGLGADFEREFITQCLSDVEDGLRNMTVARERGDWRFMREYAQGIKGVAGNVGLVRIAEISNSVVKAQDWKLVGESVAIMERLEEAFLEGRELLLARLTSSDQAASASN